MLCLTEVIVQPSTESGGEGERVHVRQRGSRPGLGPFAGSEPW